MRDGGGRGEGVGVGWGVGGRGGGKGMSWRGAEGGRGGHESGRTNHGAVLQVLCAHSRTRGKGEAHSIQNTHT